MIELSTFSAGRHYERAAATTLQGQTSRALVAGKARVLVVRPAYAGTPAVCGTSRRRPADH